MFSLQVLVVCEFFSGTVLLALAELPSSGVGLKEPAQAGATV